MKQTAKEHHNEIWKVSSKSDVGPEKFSVERGRKPTKLEDKEQK